MNSGQHLARKYKVPSSYINITTHDVIGVFRKCRQCKQKTWLLSGMERTRLPTFVSGTFPCQH